MDVTRLFEGLNDAQREAVGAPPGPLLVLAGAGSGKTRVLTHRVAWLLATEELSPHAILAVTFTNKAAAEMRGRIESMLGFPVTGMWIGTFHGLSHRLLRSHWREAGLPQTFQILDQEDQYRLVRRVLKNLNLDEGYWPPRQMQRFINSNKEAGRRPQHITAVQDPQLRQQLAVYKTYEETCKRSGLVDFAELLLRAYELLRDNAPMRSHYQNRFRHVLVDEFQDTNSIQYAWLRLFVADPGEGGQAPSLFVVGDDDQCLPAGAQVLMADGKRRPIESIQPGDQVLSSYGGGDFRAARVLDCFERRYSGPLVVLHTRTGRRIASTPEHTHFAGYLYGESPQMYFLYLMYKEGIGYRLGTTQVYTGGQAKPQLGFKLRSIQEHADAVWIIRTHTSENDSRSDETITSLHYGIPTLPFVPRKGGSRNGLVHDPEFIRRVFGAIDTQTAAHRLLEDIGLDPERPHHRPQSRNSNRRNIVVTLCGDARGRTPMHRISVAGIDTWDRTVLESAGFSVRPAKRNSPSWRFESARKDFGEIMAIVRRIRSALGDARVILNARILNRSLPFIKASAVRTGMAIAVEDGNYDFVEHVELSNDECVIHDINIAGTHNFVSDGVVTHNSIYGWRGAKVENILKFEHDFPGTRVIRLEQNYRSTGTILKAANGVIQYNTGRLGKNLWTADKEGEPIQLYTAHNDFEEARFVVDRIESWVQDGGRRSDVAVLYRSNAQSRVIEETLVNAGMPYRVYGGLRFFERAEIKDALAYLRLIASRHDDPSFERIANVPARGIGNKTLDILRETAKTGQRSLWQTASGLLASSALPARAAGALGAFLQLIDALGRDTEGLALAEQVEHMLAHSGLMAHYKKEKGEKGEARVENLEELVSAARTFEYDATEGLEPLSAFLAHAALEAGEGQAEAWEDCVQLMSLHSAKGLEFPLVFLTGMEEGLFPHQHALNEPGRLEEERRLCYVGMTRAKRRLTLTHAEVRRLHGSEHYALPSRFLGEIPAELIQEVRAQPVLTRTAPRPPAAAAATAAASPAVRLGQRVHHVKFGEGVVLNCEGRGEHTRVQVNFERAGHKWLVLAYANLRQL